jgi:hypothetical protein
MFASDNPVATTSGPETLTTLPLKSFNLLSGQICKEKRDLEEALIKSTCADYRQIFSLTRRFFTGILSYCKENQGGTSETLFTGDGNTARPAGRDSKRSQREKMAVRCARGFIQWFLGVVEHFRRDTRTAKMADQLL